MNRRGFLKTLAGLPALAFFKPTRLDHIEHAMWVDNDLSDYRAANLRVQTWTTTNSVSFIGDVWCNGDSVSGTATKEQFLDA